jgi:nucleotidyltransferase/DNA polymerase involved in DNA repair
LKQDSRDLSFILEKTDQLCNEIHATIAAERVTFKTVGIIAILTDMSIHTRSKTLENHTNDLEIMKDTVRELFEKFPDKTKLEARRVGVKISNLVREKRNQKQLTSFVEPSRT